jgi:hypothetical protein
MQAGLAGNGIEQVDFLSSIFNHGGKRTHPSFTLLADQVHRNPKIWLGGGKFLPQPH